MTNKIFFKTLKFVWLKLALGLATVLASIIWLLVCTGLTLLFDNGLVFLIMLCLWLGGTAGISRLINAYFGYLIKAGHVAIVTQAVVTGQVPDNQLAVATQTVKARFATSNVYFVLDRLVSGSVKQLQNVVGKAGGLLQAVPGMKGITSFAQTFISMALNYVDECCLGYTFYRHDQNAFKSAADGVVIYFQNWKRLLKNAAVMSIMVIAFTAVAWGVIWFLFGSLFALLGWNSFVAAIIALLVAVTAKTAFIDSYMMVKMMVEYMQVAPTTQITFDLYGKLSGMSRKFRDLLEKSGTPAQPAAPAAAAPAPPAQGMQ